MSKTRNPDALIRIGDAINVLCREKCYPGALCPDSYCSEMWDEFEEVERVDAVPVVRCKDCRWRKDKSGSTAWMPCRALITPNDFYCPSGERKDGEHETDQC